MSQTPQRFHGSVCDAIKQGVDLLAFCEEQCGSVFIPGANGWFNTNCIFPSHEDTSPSFGVNRDTGRFNCFGCGLKGTAIDLVMALRGVSLAESISYLARYIGLDPTKEVDSIDEIRHILSSVSAGNIAKGTLMDALSASNIKSQRGVLSNSEYYATVCEAFEKYNSLDEEEFRAFVYG